MNRHLVPIMALVSIFFALHVNGHACYAAPPATEEQTASTNEIKSEALCPAGNKFSLVSGGCAPVRDVRAFYKKTTGPSAAKIIPDLAELRNNYAAKLGLQGNGMPVPGGTGAGIRYSTGFLQALNHAELHTFMFVYPNGVNPSGTLTNLYTTATNRTEDTLEVLGWYSESQIPGQGQLLIYDWSCSPDYPCQQMPPYTSNSFQFGEPFSSFPCNMTEMVDGDNHTHTTLYYINESEMLDTGTPPLWANTAYLWDYCNNEWDLIYQHQFRINQIDCSIGFDTCAFWGPQLETFDTTEPEINDLGFQFAALYHDGTWSYLSPSETSFISPVSPWTLLYLDPYRSFSVGNYVSNTTVPVPPTPTGLTWNALMTTEIYLSWNLSSGATGYNIYNGSGGSFVGTTSESYYTVTGLSPLSSYAYTVTAFNSAGESARSNPVTVTTLSQPPTSLPLAIIATQDANGSITPSGTTTVNSGSSQTYMITPSTGYSISSVLVDGTDVLLRGAYPVSYTFSDVTSDHNIGATFVAQAVNPRAYISNSFDNTISVIDTGSNSVVATVPVGTYPVGVAVNPSGNFVYVANEDSNNISEIDTGTNTVVDTIGVGSGPHGVAVNPSGTFVYVTNFGSNNVSVIDTYSNADSVVATVPVGLSPEGVAVNPAGTLVYVTNVNGNNVSVINTSTNSVVATVPVGTGPLGVAVNPAGTLVYIANNGSNSVSVINTSTNSVVATVPVGTEPWGIAINPSGTLVYVTNNGSNNVSVINTGTNSVVATVPVGSGPQGAAVNPAGTLVYVTNDGSNNVSVINTGTNSVVATVPAGSVPVAFGSFIGVPPSYPGVPPSYTGAPPVVTTYTVTPSSGAGGSISASSPQTVDYNGTISFTVTPNTGYSISAVTGCNGTLTGNTYTTGLITGNCTVSAAFATNAGNTFVISAAGASNGSITPSGVTTVSYGGSTIYTITPSPGYLVSGVQVDGSSEGLDGAYPVSYTFNNVTANHTISATFAAQAVNPRAYIPNEVDNTVSVIDTGTNSVIAIVDVGSGPSGVAVNPAGTLVYVTNSRSNTVSVLDTSDNSVISTVPVGTNPLGVAVNPAGTLVYVTNESSNTVSVIDTITNNVIATVDVGSGPYGVAVNPAGTYAYVANSLSNNVSVINTSTNGVAATVTTAPVSPLGVAMNPAGTYVYLTDNNPNSEIVAVMNTSTNSLSTITVGTNPMGVAVNPAGTYAYVANSLSNNVSVINTSTRSVVATVTVGQSP